MFLKSKINNIALLSKPSRTIIGYLWFHRRLTLLEVKIRFHSSSAGSVPK